MHLLKNDRGSVFQTHPKPNRNESNGEHSWRLVFVADGGGGSIITERTGAGANQLTIGPNPNSCLNFISGISRYLAHILCTFLFLSLGGKFPQGGLLWQKILCRQ